MNYYSMVGPNDPALSLVRRVDLGGASSEPGNIAGRPVRMLASHGVLVDYPPNDLTISVGLFSKRLKQILSEYSILFEWFDVVVLQDSIEFEYFGLRATSIPDVLDETKTIRNARTQSVIKPVLSRRKIGGLHLFLPYENSPSPVCSDRVRKRLLDESITGVEFTKRPHD